jgi:hypothetical protein
MSRLRVSDRAANDETTCGWPIMRDPFVHKAVHCPRAIPSASDLSELSVENSRTANVRRPTNADGATAMPDIAAFAITESHVRRRWTLRSP